MPSILLELVFEHLPFVAGSGPLGAVTVSDDRAELVMFTEPEDVADTVLFLASDESKFITAHEIALDAGVTEF
jgi:NAD(P)-dependent dehydrogenase (short-subunit alcohol dehydrogenase family)